MGKVGRLNKKMLETLERRAFHVDHAFQVNLLEDENSLTPLASRVFPRVLLSGVRLHTEGFAQPLSACILRLGLLNSVS